MMEKRTWLYCLLGMAACWVALLLPRSSEGAAAEKILRFHGAIVVHEDASMTVRETIQVRSAGQEIKRGIYRDFPTSYRDRHGNRHHVGFDVQEVLRDGKPEEYHVGDLSNGKRVYMGRKDVFLTPGEYTYTLVYKTDRQLGFFTDHDELYWNVTGNGWSFPVDEASATIELPPAAGKVLSYEAFTGVQGAQGKDFRAWVAASEQIAFVTTKPLGPYEGLTIVVSWPKGLGSAPSWRTQAEYFVRDIGGSIAGLIGLAVLLAYYLIVWVKVGKDPAPGPIIPLYEPPAGMSPGAMRYILDMGYDHRVFAAATINMAVKGFLTIREEHGVYTLTRKHNDFQPLSPEEKEIASKLLGSRDSIELKTQNHSTIKQAIVSLTNSLRMNFEKNYFITNTRYFVPGLALSLVAVALTVFADFTNSGPVALFLCVWLTFWSIAVLVLLKEVITRWKAAIFGRGHKLISIGSATFATLFSLPFVAGEGLGLYFLAATTSLWVIASLVAIAVLNTLFYHLLKAPTRMGRTMLDKIEGFKLFLAVTEKDRLNLLNPPEQTPELFEKYLPYALALGVEQSWAEQFAAVIAGAGEGDAANYSPNWYSGNAWHTSDVGGFADSLGSSFSSAVSSSSTAPGSSSGSGGGGSSGGGGGGGGGGGW
jgi:uncharacterized membrane protein YgcG